MVLLEDVSLEADAILSGKDVKSIKQLKGQKVAYEEGTTSDILLAYALSQNGMSKDDIKPVPIPASDAGTAFLAGRVPIAVTYEPYLTTALQKDKNAKLLYTAGENPGLIGDVFAVSEDTIKNKPGQVAALIKSWSEAVQFYNDHPKEAQAIITKAVGVEAWRAHDRLRGREAVRPRREQATARARRRIRHEDDPRREPTPRNRSACSRATSTRTA